MFGEDHRSIDIRDDVSVETVRAVGAPALVAVATGESGREVFVSLDEREFSPVDHFPMSLAEAESLVARGHERSVIRDELIAEYGGNVAVLRLTENGHGPPKSVSGIPDRSASEAEVGAVTGRVCNEQIKIRLDRGETVSVRVDRDLGMQLDLGRRALVVRDQRGSVVRVEPIKA